MALGVVSFLQIWGCVMAGVFYNSEVIGRQVLEHLRGHDGAVKAGPIALALGLPLWVVSSALDVALLAKQVAYEPIKGYSVVPVAPGQEKTDWSAA